jgi:hypothetical protein
METFAAMFDPAAGIAASFEPRHSEATRADESRILAMLRRRPCTSAQIQSAYGLHLNEISKHLGLLMKNKQIAATVRNHEVYYTACGE